MRKSNGMTWICVLFLLILAGCGREEPKEILLESAPLQTPEDSFKSELVPEKEEDAEALLIVYVCGQVRNPGVFSLAAGSRINDALNLAGGFEDEADIAAVNLAAPIVDGMKIYIPKVGEVFIEAGAGQNAEGAKVDINKADVTQLCTLPGIGESRAKDIVAYRDRNGRFQKPEDLMKVSGIKESTYQKLEEYIVVGN